jgi:hypothetical protein
LRLVARALLGLAVAAGVLAIGGGPAEAVDAGGAQERSPVSPPPDWQRWDRNGDDRLTVDEWDRMSERDQETLRGWMVLAAEQFGEDAVRAWARGRFDAPTYVLADVPAHDAGPSDATDLAVGLGSEAAGAVAESAADSALESIANSVGDAAADLSGYLGNELARTGRPQLTADWYQENYRRMLGWAGLLIVPLALASIGSAVAKGDTSQVGQTLLQVPIAYLLGIMAVSLVSAVAGLSVAMARSLVPGIQDSSREIGTRVGHVLTVSPQMGQGLVLLLGLVTALAALATLLWLLLTEAAVYAVVLFFPLAFAGRVWPATAAWGRRLLTMALALIGARVVIFALWGLAMDGLADASAGDVPLRSALALAALLVMTAFSPTAALRLVPLVEGAETAGSPGAVAQRGLGVAYQGSVLGRSMGMARAGGGGGRLPVTGQIAGAAARVPSGMGAGAAAGPSLGAEASSGRDQGKSKGPGSAGTESRGDGRPGGAAGRDRASGGGAGSRSAGDSSTGSGGRGGAGGSASSSGEAGAGGPGRGSGRSE